MESNEIIKGHKYLFLDWYRKKVGELAPVVEVVITDIPFEYSIDGIEMETKSYKALDKVGITHFCDAHSLRPLDWVDDRAVKELARMQEYMKQLEDFVTKIVSDYDNMDRSVSNNETMFRTLENNIEYVRTARAILADKYYL